MVSVDPGVIVFNYLCVLLLGVAIGYAVTTSRARSRVRKRRRSTAPTSTASTTTKYSAEDTYLSAIDIRERIERSLIEARRLEREAGDAWLKQKRDAQ